MSLTRIFFTSDVHGSDVCFIKFLNAAKFYEANILILGGDLTGKMIVPVIERSDGDYDTDFLGRHQTLPRQAKDDMLKQIRDSGYYPYETTSSEAEKLREDKRLVDELFTKVMVDGVKRWTSIAEGRLKGTGVECYISPGNDDRFEVDRILKESQIIHCPEDDVVWLDKNHEMITSSWTNHTPWHSPRETSEDTLTEMFTRMTSRVQRPGNCIFNLHVPPYNTPMDLAPELDATLKPMVKGGGMSMVHVGSTAVRKLIEKHQPLLGLHGHIHESRGFCKIGRTLCINPGSEYGEGILRGAIINLDDKKVKSYILTQG